MQDEQQLGADDIEEIPTRRMRPPTYVPRPPALPREYRPEIAPSQEALRPMRFVESYRVLERLTSIDARLKKMEKRFWVLVALTVAGQKLDIAQLLTWLK